MFRAKRHVEENLTSCELTPFICSCKNQPRWYLPLPSGTYLLQYEFFTKFWLTNGAVSGNEVKQLASLPLTFPRRLHLLGQKQA